VHEQISRRASRKKRIAAGDLLVICLVIAIVFEIVGAIMMMNKENQKK